jgi:hypothetical protein
MSGQTGRNEPCPCGSGSKYKRCCLARDEAAARQTRLDEDDAPDGVGSLAEGDESPENRAEMRNRENVPHGVSPIPYSDDGDPEEAGRVPIEGAIIIDFDQMRKRHRQQGGSCALCGADVTRSNVGSHLMACAPAHDLARGPSEGLAAIRVTSPGLPAYWLDVEVRREARLEGLDQFLRRHWLECCGHLSRFRIGDRDFFSRGYEFDRSPAGAGRGPARMSTRFRDVGPGVGERFAYEYDFGSTTSLDLRITGERTGRPGRQAVRLLARNTPPVWPCAVCGERAAYVCQMCLGERDAAFVCERHRAQHGCEEEGFLPVVNSPRMGVCGYAGDS